MLPNISLSSPLTDVVRLGCALSLLALLFSAGCSHRSFRGENLSLAPSLEMGTPLTEGASDTEAFAITNEGRHIEDRLLNRQRATLLPD